MKTLIKSLPNIRDYSKYTNSEGLNLIPYKLIRGDCLNNINKKEFIKLNKYIKVIIDLRTSKEISKSPDKYLDEFLDIKYYNISLTDEEFFKEIGLYDNIDTFINNYSIDEFNIVLKQMYSQFITNDKSISSFKKIFKIILENVNNGIYYHCVTGRDRTGILTAVIMLALDFSEKDIINEYLLTNKLRKKFNKNRIKYAKKEKKSKEYIQKLIRFSIVDEINIITFLSAIKKRYESYNSFLTHIGLNDKNISILKNSLLCKKKN